MTPGKKNTLSVFIHLFILYKQIEFKKKLETIDTK